MFKEMDTDILSEGKSQVTLINILNVHVTRETIHGRKSSKIQVQ